MSKRRFTPKQYKTLLDNMVILVDTREKTNQKIIEYFDRNNIPYKVQSLSTGDYSFYVRACEELDMPYDLYYQDELVIERKNSVSEIAGNLNEKDSRFLRELGRFKEIKDVHIIVENDRLDDIIEHNYRSKMNELSFFRTILTLQRKYNFRLEFVKKENLGFVIYELCKNYLDSKILK